MLAFVNHWELLIILAVVLLLFGHRLPGMARSLGSGITEFKRGLREGADRPRDDKAQDDRGAERKLSDKRDDSNDGPAR